MNSKWLMLGCLLASGAAARADIKYTQETRMGDAGADAKPMSKTTTYVKQGFERAETTTQFGNVQMTDVTLTLCEKKQHVRLNPKLKIYAVSPLDGAATGGANGANGADGGDEKPGTGKMVMTYAVQDLGEETVANFKTRRYMINMRMQSSGCAGDSDTNMKMEIWVADIRDANGCKDNSKVRAMAGRSKPGCKITFEQKGEAAKVNQIYNGLVMRLKMYNGDKVMMVQEITMLSQAKLDDAPFAVPADYRQVSDQEFQQMQSQAMMQAMTEQSKKGGATDNNNDANDNDNDANDENKDNAKDEDENKDEAKDEAKDEDKDEPKDEPQEQPKKRKRPKFKLPF